MSTYAIGDIQGCYDELQALLERIEFDPAQDRLWFAGDLVNRGPRSLQVLRYVKSLGDAAESVLGNHDLHLLALAYGNRSHASDSSLDEILHAPDKVELIDWLRHRPMLLRDEQLDMSVIHAGLPPQWDLATARSCAGELEQVLQSDQATAFFHDMYGNKPKLWAEDLSGIERLRFITNCFTRLRFCTAEGKLGLKFKGPPGSQEAAYLPWFDIEGRQSAGHTILFGHWSTLGLLNRNNVWSLDSGCLWGGELTALRLDDQNVFQLPCRAQQNPKHFQ
ncbi:MAG: symmetrical bis(5'-nucleosyl)-tetraphosphatase [Chromatiales bacterium]|jgi:bis(5'-nucleosyl)-tetraphosphatase (symmetrical)